MLNLEFDIKSDKLPDMKNDVLSLGGVEFSSRLLTGTGKFSSRSLIAPMLKASGSQIITIALRRIDTNAWERADQNASKEADPGASKSDNADSGDENILNYIPDSVTLLPNTSGARTAMEAVRIARIAKAAGCGRFIKIEVITDMHYLLPDNHETLKASEILAKEGFIVLPYIMPDIMVARQLYDAGAAAVMPLGSPIGTNRGLEMKPIIKIIIEKSKIPVIVDAGIGRPSHAAEAMEMGADAVLVNTAIATSNDPVLAGKAFGLAVKAGRMAYFSQMAEKNDYAVASSPLTGFLRE